MGTKRTFFFCGMLGGLVFLFIRPFGVQAQSYQGTGMLAQNANYPPLVQAEFHQQFQATNDEHLLPPKRHRLATSIQQGDSRLLESQQSSSQFPNRFRSRNVGLLNTQPVDAVAGKQDQDPFGENQAKDVKPVPKEIDDKIDPLDPRKDDPKPQENPFSDPPGQKPKQDPVIPNDGQFKPNPTQQPKLPDADVNRPDDMKPLPGDAVQSDDKTPPPKDQDPAKTDVPSDLPSKPRRSREVEVVYNQGKPLQEAVAQDARVYWPPPTPILQPWSNQVPLYKPDYQPIPGLPSQSVYIPPDQVPNPPGFCAPPVAQSGEVCSAVVVSPEVAASIVAPDVVVEQSDVDCVECGSECPNFYFSVFGGSTGLRDLEGYSGIRRMAADSGGGVGVALGRRNGRNLRTEAEFSYRHNNLSSFVGSPIPLPANASTTGGLNSYAGMTNAYWEFIDVPTRCFKPYVGVGVGFVSIDAEIRDPFGLNIVPTGAKNDTSLAYQWMAGINYKAYRNMDLFAEYRFFKADGYRIDPAVPGLGDRYNFETDNIFLGLRWKF